MSDLLLRLQPDDSLAWLALDAQGHTLSGTNAGAPPAETLARARRIVALVPAEAVLLLDTPRMAAPRAQFAKAVPFALEDQLASPVEELHFALPQRLDGERVPVAVVARATLRAWLDRLAREGIRPDVLLPDTLALPDDTLVIDGARALLRRGASAFACDAANLPQWLGAFGPGAALDVRDFRDASALQLPLPVAQYHERQRDPLAFFATQLHSEPALNLLQGEFAPAHRRAPTRRLWRTAALLAAAALLLGFVYNAADLWRLSRESGRLDAAQRDTLHQAFPELDKVAGAPRGVMESALKRGGGADNGGLLRVLDQVAPILAGTTRTTLKSIEYHNATLELGLRAPDVPTLDLTRERLGNLPGLKAEVTAANSADDGVDGRLRIAGARP